MKKEESAKKENMLAAVICRLCPSGGSFTARKHWGAEKNGKRPN